MLKQHKFLIKLVEQLEKGNSKEIIETMEKVRSTIVHPLNLVLYFAGNLEVLKPSAADAINSFLPPEQGEFKNQKR